ncbi:diaminopimelate decarboxylase [Natrinema pellirubrum DSM 15624]|uniref:Diaminopimelate decarboxylase n=1 Tax=Natrinema pellirubrum (strain DSM 15624 / CIP 106293 / JCM 10476 / NCIMB 786 / 157) TaxID=797303 RepID=L0JQ98_NATP1|nr:diaminopimelate decarboxylase [Natrinema pellirubrum]AGB33008.1 diaminopimelate decarboxylase [Natrinema pellirubrum DSM 15624]ELY75112.1 diaminopimelate decarboxylase [Natrinema pellirubrum DSM 15624]
MTDDAASVPVRRLSDWDAAELHTLVEDYGSPLYVLDLERVRENYRRLETAFPDAEILYAVKANALGDVLSTLHEAGAGLECASAGEVQRALEAGASGSEIHYTAVNPPARDLDWIVDAWADEPELTVTAGSADTIDRLEERGYDGRLCLRVNPGIGAGHHEKVKTGAAAKFGVPAERAVDVLADAADRGFDVVGIHAHVGSGVSSDQLDAHREFVARMGGLARSVADAVGGLEFVDVGGGFGVPYREDETPLDLESVAETTRDALGDVDADLTIEPGRYFVADAGVLLTEVNTVKEARETTVTGVDAGMTTLLRPAMYDAYHPIRNLTAETAGDGSSDRDATDAAGREIVPQTVAGPICESGDVFCAERELPASERADILAIGNAGAYGYEMANQYNTRPRPASIVLADGQARLARRRETVTDVTRPEREARGVSDTSSGARRDRSERLDEGAGRNDP